jgi:hypothetical protein
MDERVSRSLEAIKDFKGLIQLEKNVRERVVFDEEAASLALKSRASARPICPQTGAILRRPVALRGCC